MPEEGAQTEALWQDPASPHPLEMEVVYGYDNTARSGRILPMTIRVTNFTKEDLRERFGLQPLNRNTVLMEIVLFQSTVLTGMNTPLR